MKKDILIMFGGIAPEHEVSVITGLQVVERIDRSGYTPHAIYITKDGTMRYLAQMKTRKDFDLQAGVELTWGVDAQGGYLKPASWLMSTLRPYAAYLAFHGGAGEGGPVEGFLQTLGIPHTSCDTEGSVITMNKSLTKDILSIEGMVVVPYVKVLASEVKESSADIVKMILEKSPLPLIIKPAHLGSSIGIQVARSEIELETSLLEAATMGREILVEQYIPQFTEYNCAVRLIDGQLETSEIERPLSSSEILSFADKYQRGAKKTGGSGMASLQRELPAKISKELKGKIQSTAKRAFQLCRCKGMVRIDFMLAATGELYLTEVNSIPGSMAFYLWEASGITFTAQISDLIEQAVRDDHASRSTHFDYQTDIIEKFIRQ